MKYIHLRKTRKAKIAVIEEIELIQPAGGETLAWWESNGILFMTKVRCNKKDNYCKKEGRHLVDEVIHRAANGVQDAADSIRMVSCSAVVDAFRTHLFINTHFIHDYTFPDLEYRNIPFSFINSFVIDQLC